MPLPLLMGLGLGLMGGAKYLMAKEDDKQAKSLLDVASSQLYNSPLGQSGLADPYIANIRAIATQDNGILGMLGGEPNKSERIQGLMDQALMANREHTQNQWQSQEYALGRNHDFSMEDTKQGNRLLDNQNEANLRMTNTMQEHKNRLAQIAAQEASQKRASFAQDNIAVNNELDSDYYRVMAPFAPIQDNYNKSMAALDSNNPADVMASGFNFMQIVEPGGMFRENESQQYKSVGGAAAEVANALNAVQGEGLNNKTREQLRIAINNQYKTQYDRYGRIDTEFGRYEDELSRKGYQVMSPRKRLGLDFKTGFRDVKPKGAKNEKGQTPAEAAAEKQGLVIQK